MNWIKTLNDTFNNCYGKDISGEAKLMPISHTKQNAHIEVVINGDGKFRRATVVESNNATLIPCTEASASRSGVKPVHHPLCDKLQYLAGDFLDFGGTVTKGYAKTPTQPHDAYMEGLTNWTESVFTHPKLHSIMCYLKKKRLVKDLIAKSVIPLDKLTGHQMIEWSGDKDDAPAIFKVLPKGYSPLDAFVRWKVEIEGEPRSATWEDTRLVESWTNFDISRNELKGLCFVSGEETAMADQHPSKLRHAGDKAKLVSSNDNSGYTFRGRFLDADQAAGVGFEITQKAHNALRWLIERQGYRNGDLVYVAWCPKGVEIPDPFADTRELFGLDETVKESSNDDLQRFAATGHDVGQHFANQLNAALAGYKTTLKPHNQVVVMGVDSATPGRLSITYYRNLLGSGFLERIKTWHATFAWPQTYSSKIKFVGAPSLGDIAEAAYGKVLEGKTGQKLKLATVQRLVPCVVDGAQFPIDLVRSATERMTRRMSMKDWEWNKYLGITCALIKGQALTQNKEYAMALEANNKNRDYLYGRLLAIAEHIESRALYIAGEKRDTTAARQMQRFADFPFSTWKSIELSLSPYRSQLRSRRGSLLLRLESELDDVMGQFSSADFRSDKKLSGEFLLGYHCQRQELWHKSNETDEASEDE